MFLAIMLSLLAGGMLTSLAEYKFNYNLVDLVIDKFRSAEAKAARASARLKAEDLRAKQALSAIRKAI